MKATHNGHCQCCGRLQALPNGTLSKHGYTVDWGYFNGVCAGENNAPLETSRELLDTIVTSLRRFADEMDARAVECQNPEAVDRCTIQYRDGYQGRRAVTKRVTLSRAEYALDENKHLSKHGRTWKDQVNAERYRCESQARQARSHADSMLNLAEQIHGKTLQLREVENKPERMSEHISGDSMRDMYAKVSKRVRELEAKGLKVTTRRSGYSYATTLYYNAN